MLQYDHFWPNLINRKDYSPKERELNNQYDELYSNELFFDIIFRPAWDTISMDPDAAQKANKIAYTCEIKVNGLGKFTAELSEEDMTKALNETLAENEYKKIKREAGPDVNEGMFAGLGWLAEKFGFKPFEDPVNIKQVNFFAPLTQKYGYDQYDNAILAGNYDNISIKGKQYYVPWKSAAVSQTDSIVAVVVKKESDKQVGDTLKFTTTNGKPVNSFTKVNDTTYRILLPPMGVAGDIGLLATYSYTDSTGQKVTVNAGQANISSFDIQNKKLVVVPVNNNGANISASNLKTALNNIYNQAATSWTVEKYLGNLQVSEVYADDNKLDDGGTGTFTNYTDEMNEIIDAYRDMPGVDIDKNTCYLFLVDKPKSGNKCGYMPLKRQFGFIFTDKCTDELERTIAHELGHGPFRLYHTFSGENAYTQTQGTTNNLMDYAEGSDLYKYQWDLIHDPQSMIALFQDEEDGAIVRENHTRALARLIKTINCAHNNGKKEVKLYLPFSTITASVSGLVSELDLDEKLCTEDAEVKATLYEIFGEVVDLSNDYLEDVFSLEDIGYNESNKIITLKGSKYKLLITGEKEDALCAYNFAKNNLFGSLHVPKTTINYTSLDDLQYASPCELQYLSIESRKSLLQKIQSETNWYNGTLKDSRQKITINVIATTPKDKQGDLLLFLYENNDLLKNLYDRIDDYRGEFVDELYRLYLGGKESLKFKANTVAFGLQPGIIEIEEPWWVDVNIWGYLYSFKKQVYVEYESPYKIAVYLKEYRGLSIALESKDAEKLKLCEGYPFDIIKGIDVESGELVDVPLIYFLHKSEEEETDAVYKDLGALGKKSMDLAMVIFGVKNLQGASALLRAEVTAQNVARLVLGVGDMATLGMGAACKGSSSEFCEAYKKYELLINMGLLSANILNEFPQIYKSLKKGLDDPNLSQTKKDGLRKVLGETDDILTINGKLATRIKELGLTKLLGKLEKLDNVSISKFYDDFAEATDDVLRNLSNDDELLVLWKNYSDEFKGARYITEDGVFKTCQNVLDNHPDGYLSNLVKKVMDAPKPTNSEQVLVGVTHPSFNGKVFMGRNFKSSERALEATFKTETAHPLIRERIKYMDFVRNSVTDNTGKVINETLANKLLDIDNLNKLTTAGRAGYHGEVRALSDALYELEKTRPVTSSTLSEFDLFIRSSSNKVMQRCPCCFYITNGVKVLGGN